MTGKETNKNPSRMMSKALQIVWGDIPIIDRGGGVYEVPSQSTSKKYPVNLPRKTCGCEYFRDTGHPCKHMLAARIYKQKTAGKEIAHVSGSEDDRLPNPYKNPPWYDRVKTKEAICVRELLRCLGVAVPYEKTGKKGHPPARLGDLLVCAGLATYDNKPSRRAISDPIGLIEQGLLTGPKTPAAITLRKYMPTKEFGDVIEKAVRETVDCARELETEFLVDSTYFKTPLSQIQIQKRGAKGKMVLYKILTCKLHTAMGRKTFMILGAMVSNENEHDGTYFLPVMNQFWGRFRVDRVYGDAAYGMDSENYEAVAARGGEAYLDFVAGRKPQGNKPHHDEQLAKWADEDSDWLENYRFRTLVECGNSILKRTIKRVIRARGEVSRHNELMLLVLVHNLCRLIVARKQFGIAIPFADERAMAVIDEAIGDPEMPEAA